MRTIEQKLNAPSGWEVRGNVATLTEDARCSLSAAQHYLEQKNWAAMLTEIEDALREMDELKRSLEANGWTCNIVAKASAGDAELRKAAEDMLRHDDTEGIVDQSTEDGWVKTPKLKGIIERLRSALPNHCSA